MKKRIFPLVLPWSKWLVAGMLISSAAQASIDWDQYDLNEKQKALIVRLEQKGIAEKTLREFAEALERSNNPVPTYIPEHSLDDLMKVMEWAAGGAFFAFAKEAGVEFDRISYMADCPHPELFYFGKATGTEFLRLDIMNRYINEAHRLNQTLINDPQNFPQRYLEFAVQSGFDKYLKPISGN